MSDRQETGFQGQDIAHDFLLSRGFVFVEQNYRAKGGEIDLIFLDDDQYVFVEVKTRNDDSFGIPESALTDKKKERMRKAALTYFVEREIDTDNFRFDAVTVILSDATIRHHVNIMT